MIQRLVSRLLIVVLIGFGLGACSFWKESGVVGTNPPGRYPVAPVDAHVGGETSSPWQSVLGVRANILFAEREAGALYGFGGVQRQWFDGGHDNVFTAGIQGRRMVSEAGTWLGAEGTYNNWRVSDGSQDPVASVLGVGALVGHPIGPGAVHVWGSAGLLFFSDFKADGSTVYEGGNGFQFNVGVELRELLGGN